MMVDTSVDVESALRIMLIGYVIFVAPNVNSALQFLHRYLCLVWSLFFFSPFFITSMLLQFLQVIFCFSFFVFSFF